MITQDARQVRPVVIFVGAFGGTGISEVVGGQLAACRALLESRAAREVEWRLIDSTMLSIPPPSFAIRVKAAVKRVVRVLWLVSREQISCILLFTADGMSFLEKGTIGALGRLLGKHVVLAPRSGMLIDDLVTGPWVRRLLWRVLFCAPNVVVCQSDSWARFFAVRLRTGGQRLEVIRNGIRIVERQRVQRTLSKHGAVTFLYLGWLERFKGPDILAAAFLKIHRSYPEVRLRICGRGTLDRELREHLREASECGQVEFAGWVEGGTKEDALNQSDCLVLPSLREGAPNVVLEALERGLPVICTRVGAVPEMLQLGRLGTLVTPGSIEEMATALENFIHNPCAAIRVACEARSYVKEVHDLEKTGEQWVSLVRSRRSPITVV